ncbi:MAG: lipopolysaccharide heptosyltransferase II, partial [Candidatus Omnitrophica bacterium]|nr:lipopolysaccharide heptosyltransferase II [Candidatus Omnitrophota bacterium]MBD3269699.1 lipopolysaccharide heptosyltransferase II [Candidatus Omnitrophota bacterium]
FDEKKDKWRILRVLKLIIYLKNKRFDTVFFIQRSFTRIFLCFLARIPERIGYRRLKTYPLLTKTISPPASTVHRQNYYLELFRKNGIPIKNTIPRILPPESKIKHYTFFVRNLKKKYSCIAGINPSANWKLKRWPAKNFSALAQELSAKFNCAVFLFGTRKDCGIAEEVVKGCSEQIYNFCGKTDLNGLIALLSFVDVFISADSGPAHLVSALNKPTIVIFGPTSEEITAPRGLKTETLRMHNSCSLPCYVLDCPDNVCMKMVKVEDVLSKVKKLINHELQNPDKFSYKHR